MIKFLHYTLKHDIHGTRTMMVSIENLEIFLGDYHKKGWTIIDMEPEFV